MFLDGPGFVLEAEKGDQIEGGAEALLLPHEPESKFDFSLLLRKEK